MSINVGRQVNLIGFHREAAASRRRGLVGEFFKSSCQVDNCAKRATGRPSRLNPPIPKAERLRGKMPTNKLHGYVADDRGRRDCAH